MSNRDPVQWYDLLRIVLTWALWRRPEAERPALLAAAQAAQPDRSKQQEVQTMTRTIAEALMDEGGVRALQRVLLAALEKEFGQLPEDLIRQINGLDDLSRLQGAVLQMRRLQKLEDLQL